MGLASPSDALGRPLRAGVSLSPKEPETEQKAKNAPFQKYCVRRLSQGMKKGGPCGPPKVWRQEKSGSCAALIAGAHMHRRGCQAQDLHAELTAPAAQRTAVRCQHTGRVKLKRIDAGGLHKRRGSARLPDYRGTATGALHIQHLRVIAPGHAFSRHSLADRDELGCLADGFLDSGHVELLVCRRQRRRAAVLPCCIVKTVRRRYEPVKCSIFSARPAQAAHGTPMFLPDSSVGHVRHGRRCAVIKPPTPFHAQKGRTDRQTDMAVCAVEVHLRQSGQTRPVVGRIEGVLQRRHAVVRRPGNGVQVGCSRGQSDRVRRAPGQQRRETTEKPHQVLRLVPVRPTTFREARSRRSTTAGA